MKRENVDVLRLKSELDVLRTSYEEKLQSTREKASAQDLRSKQLIEEMLSSKQSALNAMNTLHNDEIERMATTHLTQLSILKSDLKEEKQECQTLQETVIDL